MEDETTATLDTGTDDSAIDFGGDTATEDGRDTSANPEGGESPSQEGLEKTDTAPTHRSLADLHKAFTDGEDITDEENDRILLAARKGFKTDEELDAFLSKQPAKKPAEKKTEKPVEKTVPDPAKAKSKDKVPDDPLARLVREINPTKPEPEAALTSYQALKSDHRKKGERLNTLDGKAKQVGFDSVEQVIDRAMAMEERLEAMLKTPTGRRQLLQAYEIDGEFDAPAAKAAAAVPELEELDDEEFPQGSKIKAHMAKLAKDIEARIEAAYAAKYGELDKNFGTIKTKIEQEEANRQAQNFKVDALRDAADIASYYGRFNGDFALKASADKIFAESTQAVYQGGRLVYVPKKTPHPEWPTLRRILEFRKDNYSAPRDGSVRNWVGGMMLEEGKIEELTTQAAKKARAGLLTNQRKALQPQLMDKGKAQQTDTFKVPESEEDVEAMTEEQHREFRRRLMSGDLKVKSTT